MSTIFFSLWFSYDNFQKIQSLQPRFHFRFFTWRIFQFFYYRVQFSNFYSPHKLCDNVYACFCNLCKAVYRIETFHTTSVNSLNSARMRFFSKDKYLYCLNLKTATEPKRIKILALPRQISRTVKYAV